MPEHAPALDRASRIVAIAAAAGFIFLMAWLGGREWDGLLPVTAAAFAIAAAAGRIRPAFAGWLVLPLMYVSGVLVLALLGQSRNAYQAPLLAAILGLAVSSGVWRGWMLPRQWRLPLAWWTLALIFGAAVVVIRELDFAPSLLWSADRLGNSGVGGPPGVLIVWIGYVAAAHVAGLLWFDSFFARHGTDGSIPFRNEVLLPLAVGAMAGASVAAYQGLVDIYWMSGHGWGGQGRAAGGLVDGDAFGALAGFWAGIFLALAVSNGWLVRVFASAGFAVSWIGLWASGSRMALAAGLISTGASVVLMVLPSARRRPLRAIAVAAGAIALIGALAALDLRWQTDSPLRRTIQSLPSPTLGAIAKFAEHQLWNRDAPFGTAFLWMLHDYPATGVGAGSFHTLYPDYAYLIRGHYGSPENAQSWYRHQLAELGALGSPGWIWWVIILATLLLRPRRGDNLAARCMKAALWAIAAVSMVSMPTQNVAVALTVWPALFGFIAFSASTQAELALPARMPSHRAWVAIWAAALLFAGATAFVGARSLRPPMRAVRANWTYSRGFEALDSSQGQPFRWTRKYAVEVPETSARWMRVAIGGGPPDVATRPVRVTVKRNGERVIDYMLNQSGGHTWWLQLPQGPPRVMIEIEVDRTWSPADYGSQDSRQLGVAVLPWLFSDVPPRGADAIR